jgi:hypothetical protein
MESTVITIADGNIEVNASDDGMNIGGGVDGSNPDMQSSSSSSSNLLLSIKRGKVYVNAEGDGLDSNGSISMTGGTVMVSGPDGAGGNRADMFSNLDADTKAKAEDIMEKERAGTITRE